MTVKPTTADMEKHDGRPPPRSIGLGRASIFPGFCAKHDAEAFASIEGADIGMTREEAILFGFRAMAYERFHKADQLARIAGEREMDSGHPFEVHVEVQKWAYSYRAGVERGLAEVEAWKAGYDGALANPDDPGFNHVFLRFDGLLPLAACGAFHVEHDFAGNRLQRLGRGDAALEHMALVVTSYGGRSVAALTWTGGADGPSGRLARSLGNLGAARASDAVMRLAFEHLDNVFMTPSWWEGLAVRDRARVTAMIYSGVSGIERDPGHLRGGDGMRLSSAGLVEKGTSLAD
ncbi:hypothetical protein [Brevundimonas sp. PAMC22021]|uniref:hypothetical protein n=1 Tax=Brevundimonas sp. PAMC22021 TaxID=2861285 RepID=UPI001C62E9BF|nr:hypothetical protein [Brevundimonas sp. PAMC22021]QYF86215.1 hypothetical protein KY493_10215 [Brevundimonas sp. PAMC22021]